MITGHSGNRTLADGDRHARSVIERHVWVFQLDGHLWHDMESTPTAQLEEVTTALQWIETRGAALHGYRAIRHPAHPNMIRFEVRP